MRFRRTAGERSFPLRTFSMIALGALLLGVAPAAATADADPRIGLGAGWLDAQQAASGLDLVGHQNKPDAFVNPANPASISFATSDLAFRDNFAFVGNFHGFNIYDISNPSNPVLTTSVVCPGGQGDLSIHGNLLFMSVEETRGRLDCGTQGAPGPVNPERFRGVRIFDVSDIGHPVQVAAVQTCRGSHTHSLVTSKDDPANVYVYVSGTSGVRSGDELTGCANLPATDPTTALWRIDVIRVPLAAPQDAAIVSQPRLFADGDRIDGLQNEPPAPTHPSGLNWSPRPVTNHCHDITAFPEIGLAAGACAGNGILIDISDPVNPVRVDEVTDPNFAYWHSATFNNDGTKVIFTDEWGGGTQARCRDTDQPSWGADAIFDIVDGEMEFRGYFKLPVPQTVQENCVAHNGSIVPVPGRDIMAQAWYQGGISVWDFTDSANPREIAFFDRGPMNAAALNLAGLWSTYYYNGHIYGSEIARGFDVFGLTPTADMAQAEIDAAALARVDQFNAQHQAEMTWPASFTVVRARYAQVLRAGTLAADKAANVAKLVDRAEAFSQGPQKAAAVPLLRAAVNQLDTGDPAQAGLAEALGDLADSLG